MILGYFENILLYWFDRVNRTTIFVKIFRLTPESDINKFFKNERRIPIATKR
jgi:hypothetical protein